MKQEPVLSERELELLFRSRQPIPGVHTIVTHPSCHVDEFGGMYLLQTTEQGQYYFPGIENAQVGFVTDTYLRNKGYRGFQGFFKALKNGFLIIGLGYGPFDEHADRVEKVSCTDLVRRYLDLYREKEDREVYGPLIKYINFEDNNGDNIIQNLNRVNPDRSLEREEIDVAMAINFSTFAQSLKESWELVETPEEQTKLANRVFAFLDDKVNHRRQFQQAKKLYSEFPEKMFVGITDVYGMTIFKSDHRQASRAANSLGSIPGGRKLGITLVYNSKGQFCLVPKNGLAEKMPEVIKILRQTVRLRRKEKGIPFEKLGVRGTIDEVPELCLAEGTGIIMNGSKSDPDVPGLIGNELQVKDVVSAVLIAVNGTFHETHAPHCVSGTCLKVLEEKSCHLFCMGLAHCRPVIENTEQPKKVFRKFKDKLAEVCPRQPGRN